MEKPKRLKAKARLLWQLVTTTQGVADLAEPMARVERDFSRLTKGQQTTIAMIVCQYMEGCVKIDAEETVTEKTVEVIPPGQVEVIPSGQVEVD